MYKKRFIRNSSSGMTSAQIAELASRGIESVSNIIKTISEERRKTEETLTERVRIKADLEAKIYKEEQETLRMLKEYDVDIKRLAEETERRKIEMNENIERAKNSHEERMLILKQNHEERMRILTYIGQIIDLGLKQYSYYNDYNNLNIERSPIINIDLLNSLSTNVYNLLTLVDNQKQDDLLELE